MYLHDKKGLIKRSAIVFSALIGYSIAVCGFLFGLGFLDSMIWNAQSYKTTGILVDIHNDAIVCPQVIGCIVYDNYNNTMILVKRLCDLPNNAHNFVIGMHLIVYYHPTNPQYIYLEPKSNVDFLVAVSFCVIIALMIMLAWIYTEILRQQPESVIVEDTQNNNDITF